MRMDPLPPQWKMGTLSFLSFIRRTIEIYWKQISRKRVKTIRGSHASGKKNEHNILSTWLVVELCAIQIEKSSLWLLTSYTFDQAAQFSSQGWCHLLLMLHTYIVPTAGCSSKHFVWLSATFCFLRLVQFMLHHFEVVGVLIYFPAYFYHL